MWIVVRETFTSLANNQLGSTLEEHCFEPGRLVETKFLMTLVFY